MKIVYHFNGIKPISINKAYYKHRKVLTAESRAYRQSLWDQMEELSSETLKFTRKFAVLKHSLEVNIKITVPKERFYTKAGYIGRHSIDIDNVQKLLIDFTMNKRFQAEKYGAKTLGIDDQYISKIVAEKVCGDTDWCIEISYKIKKLQKLK